MRSSGATDVFVITPAIAPQANRCAARNVGSSRDGGTEGEGGARGVGLEAPTGDEEEDGEAEKKHQILSLMDWLRP